MRTKRKCHSLEDLLHELELWKRDEMLKQGYRRAEGFEKAIKAIKATVFNNNFY